MHASWRRTIRTSPSQSPSLIDYLTIRRDLVLDQIQTLVPRDDRHTGGLYELMLDYPLRGGKAIRPALSIAVCRAAGGALSHVLPTAAVLELYHNAFLVHDDVEDFSERRRHETTLNRLHGMPTAVNVGDGMLALAIHPLLDNIALIGLGKALKILRVISRMARETAEGQMIELGWIRSNEWNQSDADYIRLVHKKTAWYSFVAPMMVGAISAGLGKEETARIGRAAIPLGIAFQIQDDILNLESDADDYGKDFCADLTEGKHTLILIHALRSASSRERAEAVRILGKPITGAGCARTVDDIAYLRGLIDRHRSIAYAKFVAKRHTLRFAGMLQRIVAGWPESEHRQFLTDLGEYTIQRAA
jgi:geranylgeranyl diphosphate synthase type II